MVKKLKTSISLRKEVLEKLDAFCEKEERNRSQVVVLALREYITKRDPNVN